MNKPRILVVDDQVDWLDAIEAILEDEYEIARTTKPDEASALAKTSPFSLVILDQRLSGDVTGLDLLQDMRRLHPDMPAIILTGFAEVDDAVSSLKRGAIDYISKGKQNLRDVLRERVAVAITRPPADFEAYFRRQTSLLEQAVDRSAYVTQHLRVWGQTGVENDAVSHVLRRISSALPGLVLVLGQAGVGKSCFLRQLARRLAADGEQPDPLLIELRALGKASTLDSLIALHLTASGIGLIDLAACNRLLSAGRIALLFDGFDEISPRTTYEHAADQFSTLAAASGNAKVIITCRAEHFESDPQIKEMLSRHVPSGVEVVVCELLDFDASQVRELIANRVADSGEADGAVEHLFRLEELVQLVRNPHMLNIAIDVAERGLIPTSGSGVTAMPAIYDRLANRWMSYEHERSKLDGMSTAVTPETRWSAITAVANYLWVRGEQRISHADLTEIVLSATGSIGRDSPDAGVAVHLIGCGSFLQRSGEGHFAFAHRSIQEWLVARAAAEEISQGLAPETLDAAPVSAMMMESIVQVAGESACRAWSTRVISEPRFGEHAKTLASRFDQRLPQDLGNQSGPSWRPSFRWFDWLNGFGEESAVSRLGFEGFLLPTVQIRALRIRDIRGIEDSRVIGFTDSKGTPRKTTLLLGDNASGKSTILQCLAIAFLGPGLASQLNLTTDRLVRHGAKAGFIEVEFTIDPSEKCASRGFILCRGHRAPKRRNELPRRRPLRLPSPQRSRQPHPECGEQAGRDPQVGAPTFRVPLRLWSMAQPECRTQHQSVLAFERPTRSRLFALSRGDTAGGP